MKRLPLLFLFFAVSVHAETVYIKAARMFDGRSEALVHNAVVAVDGTKIVSVGGAIPSGARVIDLGDAPAKATIVRGGVEVITPTINLDRASAVLENFRAAVCRSL